MAETVGVGLLFEGNRSLLERPCRALLVSRDTAAPSPQAGWIRAVLAEAERAVVDGETLVTGTGRVAYDLPVSIAAKRNAPIVLIRDEQSTPAIALPSGSLEIVLRGSATDALRDRLIGCAAMSATRIAVRSGGTMAAIADELELRGCSVRDCTVVEDDSRPASRWPRTTLSPLPEFQSWRFLTHFTREPDGAWPGETHGEYLAWLSDGNSTPRNAFTALCRILTEHRVRASGRFVRGGTPVVCWTESPPDAAAQLRGWRRGLRRWNFTPYGIAVSREVLAQFGVQPVTYGEAADSLRANLAFTQAARSGSYDWTAEREWRVMGDVDLSRVAVHDMQVLTATEKEAEFVRKEFGMRAIATG